MSNLKIEYVSKDQLKPYAKNAKLHTDDQVEQIKRSIEEFGFNDPIAVWHEDEIIEGPADCWRSWKCRRSKLCRSSDSMI